MTQQSVYRWQGDKSQCTRALTQPEHISEGITVWGPQTGGWRTGGRLLRTTDREYSIASRITPACIVPSDRIRFLCSAQARDFLPVAVSWK